MNLLTQIYLHSLAECKRSDIQESGVYFLFGKNENYKDTIYIGEAENIKKRLLQHMADDSSEEWNIAVLFTGCDLDKAHSRYLENRLVNLTNQAGRYKCLTKSTNVN